MRTAATYFFIFLLIITTLAFISVEGGFDFDLQNLSVEFMGNNYELNARVADAAIALLDFNGALFGKELFCTIKSFMGTVIYTAGNIFRLIFLSLRTIINASA